MYNQCPFFSISKLQDILKSTEVSFITKGMLYNGNDMRYLP